jgi:hypothetical protein
MQFQYNADYPGVSGVDGITSPAAAIAEDPRDFPQVQPISCARITTRVFHPDRNQVATVQNVLVRTMSSPALRRDSASSMSSAGDDFSSSSSDDSMMKVEDPGVVSSNNSNPAADGGEENAYWVQRTIREAIYGRVQFAVVLKRRPLAASAVDGAEWEVTPEHCAVKEMNWEHIRRERDRLAEDPIKEVSAMQYMKKWFEEKKLMDDNIAGPAVPKTTGSDTAVAESFQVMRETNIMMPLDLLSDDRNLYSVMPYCDGGELFERLDLNERFSEGEARYWMDQVINVSLSRSSIARVHPLT